MEYHPLNGQEAHINHDSSKKTEEFSSDRRLLLSMEVDWINVDRSHEYRILVISIAHLLLTVI